MNLAEYQRFIFHLNIAAVQKLTIEFIRVHSTFLNNLGSLRLHIFLLFKEAVIRFN